MTEVADCPIYQAKENLWQSPALNKTMHRVLRLLLIAFLATCGCILTALPGFASQSGATDGPRAFISGITYEMTFPEPQNYPDAAKDWGHDTSKGKLVERFIKSKNASMQANDNLPHVVVSLIPLAIGRMSQRPLDILLKDTGLGVFINLPRLKDGKAYPDTDFWRTAPIPADLESSLLELSTALGIENPKLLTGKDIVYKDGEYKR
jgi:hypothetical protein